MAVSFLSRSHAHGVDCDVSGRGGKGDEGAGCNRDGAGIVRSGASGEGEPVELRLAGSYLRFSKEKEEETSQSGPPILLEAIVAGAEKNPDS